MFIIKLRLFSKEILKKNIVILTAFVSALTSGCSLNNKKSKEEIHTEVYNTYSTFNNIELEDNNGEYIPFLYIKDGIYDENTIKKLLDDKNISNFGIILCPSNITYESIFKDIDLIKDIVSNYKINAPILYNISYLTDPNYKVANVRLAEAFLDKLKNNGIYPGLYGSKENIELFKAKYNEYCSDTKFKIDLNSILTIDSSNEKINITDSIKYIKDNKLNNKNNYIDDYIYTVKKGDSLSLIADMFNIKLEDLIGYNNISVDEMLSVGDTLKIPNIYYKKSEINDIPCTFEECSIGIDISEYNSTPTREKRVNQELTDEIKEKLGYEDLIKYSLGENAEVDDDTIVTFNENVYEHLNWDSIKEEVDFVSIRIGDFWISKDNKVIFDEDEEFRYNIKNCIDKNIPYFTYYVTDASNKSCAIEESEIIMNILTSIDPNYNQPIYMDIESYTDLGKNIYEYDKETIDTIDAGLSILSNNGFTVGIYSTEDICNKIKELDELKKYSLWSTCPLTYTDLVNYTDGEIKDKMQTYGYYPSTTTPIIQLTCNGKSYVIPKSINGEFGSMDIDIASKSFVKKLTK